jgi:hypothetical protein
MLFQLIVLMIEVGSIYEMSVYFYEITYIMQYSRMLSSLYSPPWEPEISLVATNSVILY